MNPKLIGTAPLAYRALAARSGKVFADSLTAVREDVDDAAPLLWFPQADVDSEVLGHLDAGSWRAGEGEFRGHIAFEHDRVDLRLVDARPGDAARDVTVKRFPTWGDAIDLIEIMNVQPESATRYRSAARSDWRRPVVEGSQILGQAIVAAGRHSPGRRAVSASMVFTRTADARRPYDLELEPITTGRTFTAMNVTARQDGRTSAVGTLLLDITAPDIVRHAAPAPAVPGPYQSTPFDMSVTGRDLRVVDDAYTGDPDAPVGPPVLNAWVRFRDVPDDQPIHAGLLAQFSGHMSIAAALRAHAGVGQNEAHRTLSTATNAISLSIHGDVQADQWLLYHHYSTFAGDGMTHSECRVYTETDRLVASFTVEAMVRAFASSDLTVNHQTSL